MKRISVVIPCYNEEKSIFLMYDRLIKVFKEKLPAYDYEIIYVDDFSLDNTRLEIEELCEKDKKVKAVFNAKNFGFTRNVFSSLSEGKGEAVFLLFGDLQDPPELLPEFVKQWENGSKVVIGQRTSSKENILMAFMRSCYYKLIGSLSKTQQVPYFTGFGLYDKIFIKVIRELDDPAPYLKGIVAEFAMYQSIVPYVQQKSLRGKSGFSFLNNYDVAMIGITSYTKTLMRVATFVGVALAFLCLIFSLYVFINKLLYWDSYPAGTASIISGIFLIGAVQLFFTGILGEYILSINTRTMKRPLVVIEKRINFDDNE